MTALEQINNSITKQLKYPSKKNEEYKYCDIDKLYTPDYGLDSGLEQINDKVQKLVSEVKSSVDDIFLIFIFT
jgi:hypothetical protein